MACFILNFLSLIDIGAMSISLFNWAAIFLYLAASLYHGINLWRSQAIRPVVFNSLGMLGLMAHLSGLMPQLLTEQGLLLSFSHAASLIAVAVMLLTLIGSWLMPIRVLLAPLFALSALLVLSTIALPQGTVQLINEEPGILCHILLSVLAYGMITIAVLQSLVLLIQEQQLRKRPVSKLIKHFPPLQSMEKLLFAFLWAGWILLSLSLASGWMFLEDIFAQHLAHKTSLAVMAWMVFAVLLWGRHQLGWRGHTAIRWTLAGFCLLMLAYFGSKLVREFILNI